MEIQYIGFSHGSFANAIKGIQCSELSKPKDFDDYDINFIDLKEQEIWRAVMIGHKRYATNYIEDFITLRKMIANTRSKVIISLPQNTLYQENLKNYLEKVLESICEMYPKKTYMVYGSTTTNVNGNMMDSDFTFTSVEEKIVLTSSTRSNKPTTILNDKVIFTSLNIENGHELINLLKCINLINNPQEDMPEWIKEVVMFDDEKQLGIIELSKIEIKKHQEEIQHAEEILHHNNKYKSILYTQGDELVDTVFKIISEMLEVDLAEFEDQKKEDIAFKIDDEYFIGEIKGISDNVKASRLSQLDNHLYYFLDKNDGVLEEDVRRILIVNHQRKKPLDQRSPIDDSQIKLAENKYGSLIVETTELLKLFEQYKNGIIKRDEIVKLFQQTGKLTLT